LIAAASRVTRAIVQGRWRLNRSLRLEAFVAESDGRLKYRDIFQERDDAKHDDDDAADLLGAAIERQHVDQIKDENNDKKGDEYTDNHRLGPRERLARFNIGLTLMAAIRFPPPELSRKV
jgi:hypothetical protein